MKQKFYINAKVKKIDKDIKNAIKKAGISYPHHSLSFFKATYAKFEEANGNKVILADSVKDDVKYLIGTQMNRDHERAGSIMGSIIDAYVTKNDEIEIVFTFAKTVYPKEYELALDLMKKDKLTVSFELMVDNKDVENVSGGNRRLTKVSFDGVGLLFGIKPAYRNAYVLETAMKIIEDAFNQEDKQLIYASAKDITKKWTRIGELIEKALIEKANYSCECVKCGHIISSTQHCKDIKCSKCGGEMRRENRPQKQNAEDNNYKYLLEKENQKGENKMDDKARNALLAKFKEEVIAELGEEAVKDWSDEQWEAELEKRASVADETDSKTTEASEEKAEESKDKEKAEEKSEEEAEEKSEEEAEEKSEETAEKTTVVVEEKIKTETTYDEETQEETIKTEAERTVERDGEKKVEEKFNREVTYSYAQMEEVKAEYDKQLKAKDEEIDFLKENAKKVVEIRAELDEFVKDLSDSDLLDESKLENARLKKRVHDLENKDVETASDESEETKDEDLKTGHEEKEQKEEESSETRVSDYLKSKYGKK